MVTFSSRTRSSCIACIACVALLSACNAPGSGLAVDAGWTRFRGPNGTGVADVVDLPAAVDPAHAVWRIQFPPGHSSPVLAGGRLFLTALDAERLWTYAVDAATGEVLWGREAPRPRRDTFHAKNQPTSPTAAVDDELVAVFFPEYGVLAYDHDGNELWRVPLGPFDNVYGMGASPILVEDRVILACDQNLDSFLIALDRRDGSQLWRTARPTATSGHCTPILAPGTDGELELILPGSFYLDAYDPTTGERRWWVSGLCFEMKSVPALHAGTIYINGYGSPMNDVGQQVVVDDFVDALVARDEDGDGRIDRGEMPPGRVAGWFDFVDLDRSQDLQADEWEYLSAALASRNGLLAIRTGGLGDMTEENVRWSYHRSIPQLPSPLVYDDVLYLLNDGGGLITTLRPDTGEVLERGRIEEAVDAYYASPVAGDGKVYLLSEAGLFVVLPAGGSLEPLSVTDLGERCYATPALANDRIYVRTEAALYAFGSQPAQEPARVRP